MFVTINSILGRNCLLIFENLVVPGVSLRKYQPNPRKLAKGSVEIDTILYNYYIGLEFSWIPLLFYQIFRPLVIS